MPRGWDRFRGRLLRRGRRDEAAARVPGEDGGRGEGRPGRDATAHRRPGARVLRAGAASSVAAGAVDGASGIGADKSDEGGGGLAPSSGAAAAETAAAAEGESVADPAEPDRCEVVSVGKRTRELLGGLLDGSAGPTEA